MTDRNRELRKVEPAEWVSWAIIVAMGLALVASLALIACDAGAQTANVVGKRLSNGDALLVAGVQDPPLEGFDATARVCFREVGAGELGCVERSAFVAVGNDAFQAGGELHTIQETLPAGQSPNLVAFLVLAKPAAFMALSRSIDDDATDPESAERTEPIVFAAFVPPPPPPPADPGPQAPTLLLLEELLQSALDTVRERLAELD